MKKCVWICMALVAMFAVSCSNDEMNGGNPQNGDVELSIQIKSDQINSRAIGTPAENSESAIKNAGVYIFDESSSLENFSHFTFSGVDDDVTIAGLTKGPKKIVVLTNLGIRDNYPATGADISYDDLKAGMLEWSKLPQNLEKLDEQGLPMSKSITQVLQPGLNTVSVTLTRLVAKVRLGSVTIDNAGEYTPADVKQVGIMNALSSVGIVDASAPDSPSLIDGFAINGSATAGLSENYTEGQNHFFYVLPYKSADETTATMLTLVSEAGNPLNKKYFSFAINPKTEGEDVTYSIVRNTVYTLNVRLKYHETGTEEPGEITDDVSVSVTLDVEDWSNAPDQNVIWD